MNSYLPLKQQIQLTEQLLAQAQQSFTQKPEGYLNIQKRGTYYQYYFQEEKTRKRTYLSKKNITQAKELAQKQYDKDFICCASDLIRKLKKLEKSGASRSAAVVYHSLAEVYEKLSPERKILVEPYVLPDELYIEVWLKQPYKQKPFLPDSPEIYTENNERVRSKSEKIIADKLAILGIPYRYEYPMIIPGIGSIHPDFLLLDVKERTTVIYEHFGIMQDPVYSRNTLRKIDAYENSGYMLGSKLLCTFESENHVLDMRHFEKMMLNRFFEDSNIITGVD